jgi:U2-associated protein SR140
MEKDNPRYSFLTDRNVRILHTYYGHSWLSISQHRRHRYYQSLIKKEGTVEPEFEDEVPTLSFDLHAVWIDDMGIKGYNSVFSTDSAEESEKERTRKTKLGKLARKRFEAMLRSLSGVRGELARCMAFSLEHAEASNEVSICGRV